MTTYNTLKSRLARSPFRSRFSLSDKDRAYIARKGWGVIRTQAHNIILKRLAPASPHNDGKQTPMRGHVIFTAQHATATCCRKCLFKWHGIPTGRSLTPDEINALTDVILAWLHDKAGDISHFPHTIDIWNN